MADATCVANFKLYSCFVLQYRYNPKDYVYYFTISFYKINFDANPSQLCVQRMLTLKLFLQLMLGLQNHGSLEFSAENNRHRFFRRSVMSGMRFWNEHVSL